MNRYYCTVLFDASSSVTVEATTPEEAVEKAEYATEGNHRLCHQCSNTLDTGESLGVLVYEENATEELLDTRHQPQRTWVGLTDEDRQKLTDTHFSGDEMLIAADAKLKEKNT